MREAVPLVLLIGVRVMAERIETFDEFWAFYLGEHRHPFNRLLHYFGTSAGLCCLAAGGITFTDVFMFPLESTHLTILPPLTGL